MREQGYAKTSVRTTIATNCILEASIPATCSLSLNRRTWSSSR